MLWFLLLIIFTIDCQLYPLPAIQSVNRAVRSGPPLCRPTLCQTLMPVLDVAIIIIVIIAIIITTIIRLTIPLCMCDMLTPRQAASCVSDVIAIAVTHSPLCACHMLSITQRWLSQNAVTLRTHHPHMCRSVHTARQDHPCPTCLLARDNDGSIIVAV